MIFRIYLFVPAKSDPVPELASDRFLPVPDYTIADTSKTVRRRLEKQHGREVASKSSVTAIADAIPGCNPRFGLAADRLLTLNTERAIAREARR